MIFHLSLVEIGSITRRRSWKKFTTDGDGRQVIAKLQDLKRVQRSQMTILKTKIRS